VNYTGNKNKYCSFNVNFMSNKNNYALKEKQKQMKGKAHLLNNRITAGGT
jgi:hypothetical protein